MSDVIDLKQFLGGFLSETNELLRTANTNLLALESSTAKGLPNARSVRELYRALHTIKGLAGMVGVNPIVDLAHALETVLRAADRGSGRLSRDAIELCLKAVKAIEDRVNAVAKQREVPPAPARLLEALGQLEPVAPKEPAVSGTLGIHAELHAKLAPAELQQLADGIAEGSRLYLIEFLPSKARAAAGFTITTVRERVAQVGEIVKVVPRSMKQSAEAPGGLAFELLVLTRGPAEKLAEAAGTPVQELAAQQPAAPEPAAAPAPVLADFDELSEEAEPLTFVRVEVARLDDALSKLSELIVSRFKLKREIAALGERGVDTRALLDIDVLYGLQLDDLRAAIMRTRMVPVAELLARIPLLVRGLSRDTGRAVRLEIDAQDAELDKAVGDRIFPAIVHLVRNAIDHAIEPPEERERLGKPREGLVRIYCNTRASNQLEIVLLDDGRGIDAAAVARRAGREAPQTDAELLELLATPGFSTLDQATTTSGRGLGMDIVKRIVTMDLRGDLTLRTTLGKGTSFSLRLPLTLTIVDVFLVQCGNEIFVVPVSSVEEIIEVEPAKKLRGPLPPTSRGIFLYERREEALTLVELSTALRIAPTENPAKQGLVVRRSSQGFIFEIERVLGQQEVVVRPIEDPLVQATGVAGATDLGNGQPVLVLDLIGLSVGLHRTQPRTEVSQ